MLGGGNTAGYFPMKYSLKQTIAPAAEPLTLKEAKAHLRIDTTHEDEKINGLIQAARIMAESYTQRQLITATYTMKINDFPSGEGAIYLPRTPIGSVSSIQYIDANIDTQTLGTDVYEVLSDDTSASIVLKPGALWPNAQFEKYEAVTITFTAGYGSASTDVPQTVRSAMCLIIGNLFENREEAVIGTISSSLPMGVRTLLDTVSVRGVV